MREFKISCAIVIAISMGMTMSSCAQDRTDPVAQLVDKIKDLPLAEREAAIRKAPRFLQDRLRAEMRKHVGATTKELIVELDDNDIAVRHAALALLAQKGQEAAPAVAKLTAALGDDTAYIRRAAADALGSVGPGARPAISELIELLGDENVYCRQSAAAAIGNIDAASAVKALSKAARDESPLVRVAAAGSLATMQGQTNSSLAILTEALGNPREEVRWRAAAALGSLGAHAKSAAAPLARLHDDADPTVRRIANEASAIIAASKEQ